MARILVADDDPKQAELIRRYAVAEGHDVRVVHDGQAVVDDALREVPDLLILDVMMPRLDGHEVCRVLRSTPATTNVPILMLTARVGEEGLLRALDLGADDYLTKPYSPRVLMARARALLRRTRAGADLGVTPTVAVGSLVLEVESHVVRFRGEPVVCTPGELSLLEVMASEPGRVFSRRQLLSHLHGIDDRVSSRTIDVHIANLRKKLDPALLRTVHGVGYSLVALT